MKNLYILGAGGFGHVIKDMAEQSGKYTKICFLDDTSFLKSIKPTKPHIKYLQSFIYIICNYQEKSN